MIWEHADWFGLPPTLDAYMFGEYGTKYILSHGWR